MIRGTVAIVGRPNVGKSTIFNRLIGQRKSIVDDTPGVTRDRIYGEVEWLTQTFRLIDTGGIQIEDQAFAQEINMQVDIAIEEADVIIYAGSLVNPALLGFAKKDCRIYNSAQMTLEEVMEVMISGEKQEKKVVRLHTGDPCLYGAIKEQMDLLEKENISYKVCPGVSSFCGAASALNAEYTLPGISQSVVITRMAGRTPVPEKESIESFAAHQATMVIFLSTGMLEELSKRLIEGGYQPETPAAIVYKATWEDEKVCRCKVKDLAVTAKENGITKTALIVVGEVLGGEYERSLLYHPEFTTEFRQGKGKEGAGNV